MIGDLDVDNFFGCALCWPKTAQRAYEASDRLDLVITLVEQSHYIVNVVSCSACGQRFVTVFTEQNDWQDGEDPCRRMRMPITEQETQSLVQDSTEKMIEAISSNRKSLEFDWPKGVERRVQWTLGLRVGSHD